MLKDFLQKIFLLFHKFHNLPFIIENLDILDYKMHNFIYYYFLDSFLNLIHMDPFLFRKYLFHHNRDVLLEKLYQKIKYIFYKKLFIKIITCVQWILHHRHPEGNLFLLVIRKRLIQVKDIIFSLSHLYRLRSLVWEEKKNNNNKKKNNANFFFKKTSLKFLLFSSAWIKAKSDISYLCSIRI